MDTTPTTTEPTMARRSLPHVGGPLAPVIDLFSSVRFGIVLLVLLFLYMSIGSAGIIYPVHPNVFHPDAWVHAQFRQWRPFEMTEFEWFHWWPFDLVMGLLSANIIITTIRRIPFKAVNYGVWMIHTGIIVLVVGSIIYFGQKVEGEAPVIRRAVVVSVKDAAGAVVARERVIAVPGARAQFGPEESPYLVEVADIDPSWELLSGADKGKRAYSVTLTVNRGDQRFMRQVVAGYPEYTEDLVLTDDQAQPVKRARKVNPDGNPIIDASLEVGLEYAGQGWFYLRNDLSKAWALYVRAPGDGPWTMRPIDGLPLYNDYIASRDEVFNGDGTPIDPIDLSVPATDPDDPFKDVALRINGFLRYAIDRSRWMPGTERDPFNPVVMLQVSTGKPGEAGDRYQLQALDPERSMADGGLLRAQVIRDEAEIARASSQPSLRIAVPSIGFDGVIPIQPPTAGAPPASTPIGAPESGWSFRVVAVQDRLTVGERTTDVAIVEIVSPTRTWRRWAFSDPALTRDLPPEGEPQDQPLPPDASITTTYAPGEDGALLTVLIGPAPGQLRLASSIGAMRGAPQPIEVGKPFALPSGLAITLLEYLPNAVAVTKPFIVPPEERQRDARELFSRVLVSGPQDGSTWLDYHPYVFDRRDDALRRHPFEPTLVDLGGGRKAEVLFSRVRVPMPTSVALDDFLLATHIGGYTGEASTIRDYTSMLRFDDGAGWSEPVPCSVNAPVEHDGWWFFQAQWDPPDQARFEGDRASRGLNYTVLGVANREGVMIQLFGCILSVVGMAYAFYVKPIIKRRKREAALALAAQVRAGGQRASTTLMVTIACAVLACAVPARADEAAKPFHEAVDLLPLGEVAVQTEGRLKSFGSFANTQMSFVSGPRRINGQSPEFTYLDLLLRPEAYEDADIVFVKGAAARVPIAEAVIDSSKGDDARKAAEERMAGFLKHGLISPALLQRPEVMATLRQMEQDLIRTEKVVSQIQGAMSVREPKYLLSRLLVIPPATDDPQQRWHSLGEVMMLAVDAERAKAAGIDQKPLPGIDIALQRAVASAWKDLVDAWAAQDAAAASKAVAALAASVHAVNPAVYPDTARLGWESWYFRNGNLTRVWLVYMAAIILLLLGLVYRWPRALSWGLAVFGIAFLLQTAAVMLRWWISQRWPNSNMFEAVTTASWFGACCAAGLELWLRRRPVRGWFALTASACSMVALMAAHFLPVQLNPNISNMMPVLHDVWLYIHTNVIIFSYALIFMAAISAGGYLLYRWRGGPATYARAGGTAAIVMAGGTGSAAAGGAGGAVVSAGGGAMGFGDDAQSAGGKGGLGELLDGVTLLLMELSFILLWAGIVMGAIWADHSWGRPWGWDPKEVFALNTFIVFALLIHVRWRVKDKGLWTAVLAVIGAAVMLFNWIVINFVITGLHSYA